MPHEVVFKMPIKFSSSTILNVWNWYLLKIELLSQTINENTWDIYFICIIAK
jgi:hypothetical protein